mmetsp:Transcript_34815/g.57579  ORF Transcript_34815/g.57579 Transcript_34815/m.57579 type:complete len:522 (+) Transcript_34815:119-1684(+)
MAPPAKRLAMRLEKHGLEPPLPPNCQMQKIMRSTAISLNLVDESSIPDPRDEDMVPVYSFYKLPKGTIMRQLREYKFEPANADPKMAMTCMRPAPPKLFSYEKSVIVGELDKPIATMVKRSDSKFINMQQDRKHMLSEVSLDIYRARFDFFIGTEEDELVDESAYNEARDFIFSCGVETDLVSREKVSVLGPHILPLAGDVYDYYSGKALNDYANNTFGLLSFASLCTDAGYPTTWAATERLKGLNLPLLKSNLFETLSKTDSDAFNKAVLLSEAVFDGVLMLDTNTDIIHERDGLAELAAYTITSGRVFGQASADGEAGKEHPVLRTAQPGAKYADGLTITGAELVRAFDGDKEDPPTRLDVKLSAAAAAILALSKTEVEYVVDRFRLLVPKRSKENRFPSEVCMARKHSKLSGRAAARASESLRAEFASRAEKAIKCFSTFTHLSAAVTALDPDAVIPTGAGKTAAAQEQLIKLLVHGKEGEEEAEGGVKLLVHGKEGEEEAEGGDEAAAPQAAEAVTA